MTYVIAQSIPICHYDHDERANGSEAAALSEKKFALTFHRTFSLSRPSISVILELAERPGDVSDLGPLTNARIREETHLGTIYVEAMPRYAIACGLLDRDRFLTDFGSFAKENDPLLANAATQWLMHYHLSTPVAPNPLFWPGIVESFFRSGDTFSKTDVAQAIQQIAEKELDREVKADDYDNAARILIGTYVKDDGLQNLSLLEDLGDDRYSVLEPEPPSPWVFGLALLHYWQSNFDDRLTINLDELYGDASLAGIFQMSAGRINRHLEELAGLGYVEIYRVAPPYQIVLLRRDAGQLWEKLYAFDDSDPF